MAMTPISISNIISLSKLVRMRSHLAHPFKLNENQKSGKKFEILEKTINQKTGRNEKRESSRHVLRGGFEASLPEFLIN